MFADVPEVAGVEGDVEDLGSLRAAVHGCEAVIHSAAMVAFGPRQAARQREVNVEGTRHVVEAARAAGVRRFVHTSSIAAIGRVPEGGVSDEDARYDGRPASATTSRSATRSASCAAPKESRPCA